MPAAPSSPLALLRLARAPLVGAALLLALGVALVLLGRQRHEQALSEQRDTQALLQQVSAELAEAEEARDRLEANLREFERLKGAGFVGEPDRLALLEALEQAATELPGVPLRWALAQPVLVQTIHESRGAQPVAELRALPLQLEADAVHEEEWLALLARLQASPRGQARLQECDWRINPLAGARRTVNAVRARCELLWLYVMPLAAAPR